MCWYILFSLYRVTPTPVDAPVLVVHSQQALDLLDIHSDEVLRKDFAEYFSGNRLIPGAEPAAHCYCGHQFGSFSGQLGDGATMYVWYKYIRMYMHMQCICTCVWSFVFSLSTY